MKHVIALTGVTGAMGGEALNYLMRSPNNYTVKAFVYEKENKLPTFVKNIKKKYGDRIIWMKGDIARYEDCVQLIDGVEYVIHCAGVIPPKSDHYPQRAYEANWLGTKNLVDAIINTGKKDEIKYVHIATVALYGHRAYPHHWGRVGDPLISSDYDNYSQYKLMAERYVLESGLKYFVSLRQTGILHKYMFANNLKDGLMFHTAWNTCLEWVTDRDSGILCQNLVDRDLEGKLDGFWNRCYNIGGGDSCRKTGYDTLNDGFAMMGKTAKDFFKTNWTIQRNFHGVWYTDSDELEKYLGFRHETFADYWERMGKKYWYFKIAKIVPASLITALVFKPLLKRNTNSPLYWVNHKHDGRVKAFFGGYDAYNAIPDWDSYPLLCEGKLPNGTSMATENLWSQKYITEHGMLLDHGYDESKADGDLDLTDMQKAAEFRGGKCLAEEYIPADLRQPLTWQCHFGHTFTATPYTVLKAGHWCPECNPTPWAYGKQAKVSPFIAQVYFDTHSADEVDDSYPVTEGEDDFILYKD